MNERTTVAKLEDLGIEPETIEQETWLDCIAEGIEYCLARSGTR